MTSLSSLVLCFLVRPGAYSRVEHQKGGYSWIGSGVTSKHKTCLERLANDKHSSLLRTFVNYAIKSFIGLAPARLILFVYSKKIYKIGHRMTIWCHDIQNNGIQHNYTRQTDTTGNTHRRGSLSTLDTVLR